MRIRTLTLIMFSAILAGCATSQTGKEFDTSKVDRIEDGETTKSEIVQWFGKPQGRGTHSAPEGDQYETYTYSYAEGTVKAESYIPFVGMFLGGSESESKVLTVHFDDSDKVAQHHFRTHENETSNF